MPTPPDARTREAAPVVVFGATGFIGRALVTALQQQGWRVRAFVRPDKARAFADDATIEVVCGDLRDADAVVRALHGQEAVINAAGLKSDEPDSEAVNVGGVRHLIAAAHAHGVQRIVHISTQAVKLARRGLYARTKLAGEELLVGSALAVTILRPSVVYGAGRSGVFSTMQRFVERLPVVPVLGDGTWTCAPLHVEDLARTIAACLATPTSIGRCYDLGGPDLVTLDQMLDRIAASVGRRCRKLHLPYPLSLFMARCAAALLPRAPVSVSNVLGSNQPLPIDSAPARRDLQFAPMSLDEGLRRLRAQEEASALREEARRFANYLLQAEPPAEIVERQALAAAALFPAGPDAEVRWIRRHRWTLPLVDAALAVYRPGSQLRQRLLVSAAVLEASPDFANRFLAPPPARPALVAGLAARAAASGLKLLGGLLLLPLLPASCPPKPM